MIATPILNQVILRNKIKDKGSYFRVVAFCLFLYFCFTFVTFPQANMVNNQADFRAQSNLAPIDITVPRAYLWFSSDSKAQNPDSYFQEVIPFALTVLSAIVGVWRRLLCMQYTLKQGYIRKMKLWVREKIKIIDEAEINLQQVDLSGNLLPRKVLRNAHVVRRHRAIFEGGNMKKVQAKSQIKGSGAATVEPDQDLLVPYKKVAFLPAYFFKVFIKQKKKLPEPEPQGKKGSKKGKKGKEEQPSKKAKEQEQQDLISVKAKKLMSQMNQDKEDFKQETKIVVDKLHKTITKESKLGGVLARYNLRRKRYFDRMQALKDKNAQLKKFDELEHMLNSYEQVLFHNHLFTDAQEAHLTKLDMFYANQHHVYS